MQSYVRRKQAMKRWRPIIRARFLIGARAVMKECFSLWHTKTQTFKWIKERLGGERLMQLQYVMKCWKSLIKERNKRRQIVIERIGRHWHAQLPLKKVSNTYHLNHVIDATLIPTAVLFITFHCLKERYTATLTLKH